MITLFFIKLVVGLVSVVGLSIIAEHVSPRVAGILVGFPTVTAISFFFFGYEISPEFASHSALYTMIGLVATQVFVYFYYKASLKFNILLSSLIATGGYFMAIWILHFVDLNKFTAIFISVISTLSFIYIFKSIPNVKIKDKVKLNHKIVFVRGICGASVLLLITGIAKIVGSTWSGLFSAFPTTLFPLMLIVHLTYDTEHVHTIIKNFPIGIFSSIFYALSVSIVYPIVGIYWGTVISYVVATIYLITFQVIKRNYGKEFCFKKIHP